jgi:hypothetical protein
MAAKAKQDTRGCAGRAIVWIVAATLGAAQRCGLKATEYSTRGWWPELWLDPGSPIARECTITAPPTIPKKNQSAESPRSCSIALRRQVPLGSSIAVIDYSCYKKTTSSSKVQHV